MIPPSAPYTRRAGSAFSLLELLVVLAIVGILAALLIPSAGPMMSSYNLNRAGSMVTDEFNFARQTAITRNTDVEVRMYLVGSKAAPTNLKFRAFRTFLANSADPTQAVGLSKISYLPETIILSSDAKYSTMLDYGNSARGGLSQGTETLPGKGAVTYVSFLFRSTGGTNLTPITDIWDLAILVETAPVIAATGLPSNYVAIQVDPVNGRVRSFRP